MTDQSLRRADELLTELVEQVETARALPMSSSCVLPRERMLDLLDELREVLPPEIDEARRVIANRDSLLHDAYAEATSVREKAMKKLGLYLEIPGLHLKVVSDELDKDLYDANDRTGDKALSQAEFEDYCMDDFISRINPNYDPNPAPAPAPSDAPPADDSGW